MAVRQSDQSTFERNIERMVEQITGLHYVNAPSHARALVDCLYGHVSSLTAVTTDDPLLYAYELKDVLPRLAGLVIALTKWSNAVIESTPDQIQDTGAQLCRSST